MKMVGIEEEIYPRRLKNIQSPPKILYYEGELPDGEKPSVAIVGARNCSEYGRQMAAVYGQYLAAKGVEIISGMAIGIDGEAQRAALLAGGRSFGVLACGTDICYPRTNRKLYEQLILKGGILSEHPAGTQPLSVYFPTRNRIISGLANLVLVVEAKEKSGTGYTVRMALEQGREVYAVPGRVTDAMSKGCNHLIAEGAGVAETPEAVYEALMYIWELEQKNEVQLNQERERCQRRENIRKSNDKKKKEKDILENLSERMKLLSTDEQEILVYLLKQERNVDEILEKFAGRYPSVSMLLVQLLKMEQKGVIENVGGYYFGKVV